MAFDDQTKHAFQFAQEASKQLISLSTGLIALEITFAKEWIRTADQNVKWLAEASWMAFLLSVIFGIWSLLALTGTLAESSEAAPSIRSKNIRLPAALQIVLFVVGILFTVLFGVYAL